MNFLFLHRNFPGQFKHIIKELAKNSENKIFFITYNDNFDLQNVNKIVYKVDETPQNYSSCLTPYAACLEHAKAAADAAILIKQQGFMPDVIYGHSWGETIFMKEVFPETPLICYFEWFYNPEGADMGFDGRILDKIGREKLKCKNTSIVMDLAYCDGGITPTRWQKSQFPKKFHNMLKVLHDGIDTDIYTPNKDAKFIIKDKNDIALVETRNIEICHCEEGQSHDAAIHKIELTANDEVITYATRGMEPYRGFPQFMKAAEVILKKRPNAHIVIAGEDKTFYGGQLEGSTYKEFMLKNLDINSERLHFTGILPFDEYLKLLQISSAHVYLTYPFVLSWSVLEAMACECLVVASDTQPVSEVIQDNYNGLLTNFFNINQLIEKIEYALDNKKKLEAIRQNARKTVLEKYSLKELLPKHIEYIKSFANKP